jgi:hypothetical protein
MLFAWVAAFYVSICTDHFTELLCICDTCAYPHRIRWHGVLMLLAWLAAFFCVYLHRTFYS